MWMRTVTVVSAHCNHSNTCLDAVSYSVDDELCTETISWIRIERRSPNTPCPLYPNIPSGVSQFD